MKPITIAGPSWRRAVAALVLLLWGAPVAQLPGQNLTVVNDYWTRRLLKRVATVTIRSQTPTNPRNPWREVRVPFQQKAQIALDGNDPYWLEISVGDHQFMPPPMKLKAPLLANPGLELKLSSMAAAPAGGFAPQNLDPSLGLNLLGDGHFLQGFHVRPKGAEVVELTVINQVPQQRGANTVKVFIGARKLDGAWPNWQPIPLNGSSGSIRLASDDPYAIWVEWQGRDYETYPIPLKAAFASGNNNQGTVIVDLPDDGGPMSPKIRVRLQDGAQGEVLNEVSDGYLTWFRLGNVDVFNQTIDPRPHGDRLESLGYVPKRAP